MFKPELKIRNPHFKRLFYYAYNDTNSIGMQHAQKTGEYYKFIVKKYYCILCNNRV